ncbi:hypothetical protein V0288_14395 [Pannus brasiliensis CCIBt3594]|uniref:Uncharacterized protein n=1 Tax=Pannus brasiliensis CCIBt3594 TaxID=1427578 RepID=A0AAW9QW86_9CHRO
MIARYLLAWIPMIFIGILNGILRETTYGKYFHELRAHQISTVTGIVLFSVYIWFLTRLWGLESAGQAIAVGAIWLLLTVTFEFLFGHYIAGHPWGKLFADYNLLAGRVWIFVLVTIAIGPFLFYRFSP